MSLNLSDAYQSGSRILHRAVSLLPNLVLAAVIFILFFILASAAKAFVRRMIQHRKGRVGIALLLARLTHTVIVIVGLLIALSVVAPSFTASDLVKMLGIGSVAIGFAFQNILQNFLAGILLLLEEPFEPGDSITVVGLEGRVDDIQTRATLVTTKEGNSAVIPNATLFTNPVVVTRK